MQYDDNIDPYRFLYFSVVHYMLAEDILQVVNFLTAKVAVQQSIKLIC